MRVASDLIVVYMISSTLPSNVPHHAGFLLKTLLTSGSRETNMYGPVPMAFLEA